MTTETTMKVLRHHSFGTPEVLVLDELAIPPLEQGQVLTRISAAPVAFYDISNRRGDFAARDYYRDEAVLPIAPGYQAAGTVAATGPGVTEVGVGDRVVWSFGSGACATHAVVPASQLVPVPDDVDADQLAGGFAQAFMAYKLTHEAYPVQPGDWCLVQSAAGGAGSLISQLAKVRGGRVIGVCSTEQKAKIARESGADEVVVSTQADVAAEVKRITGGTGVRVVYDGVGKDAFEANLDSLAPRGYFIVYGQSSGFVPPFDLMTLQDKGALYLHRYNVLAYVTAWPDRSYLDKLFGWLRSGELYVRIDRRMPLAEAAEAHRLVENRETAGRILLTP